LGFVTFRASSKIISSFYLFLNKKILGYCVHVARRSQKKESGEGGLKLEAEKDNGLDNCAPSVRYIVRRLIRDGCSRGTAMPKSYIVPLFAVQAPVDVVSWIKYVVLMFCFLVQFVC